MERARRRRLGARTLGVLGIVALGLGVASLRVVLEGESELAASTAALDAGDVHEAIVRARRAAGWYAPGAPHVRVAYERLVALARGAEEHRQLDHARLAWSAVRTAALETRWLVTPHGADLDLANRELARLSALGERAPDARQDKPEAFAAAELALLERDDTPRLGWSLALVAGFGAAASGLALSAWQLAAPGTSARRVWRYLGLGLALVGAVLWLVSWWRA